MAAELDGGWIGDRRFDRIFFFGSALAAAAVGGLVLLAPSLVVPLWWLWLWLGDGPHLIATWTRTYFDAEERRRRAPLLAASLLLLLPGPIALGVGKLVGSRLPFDLFLLVSTMWAYWHAVRQHYGILAIYSRHAKAERRLFRIDKWAMQGLMWAGYGVFLFGNRWSRQALQLPQEIPPAAHTALVVASALVGAGALLYAGHVVWRVVSRRAVRPALFALAQVALVGFAMFVMGAFEPLYPRARDPEEVFLGVTLVGGISHSFQYLGIIGATNRRRFAGRGGALSALLASPWKSYAAMVVGALGYVALIAARGISPGVELVPLGSDLGKLFISIYWGVFFHHYYLDQKIWRPHADPGLRAELNLG